jgi:hypothetical protein
MGQMLVGEHVCDGYKFPTDEQNDALANALENNPIIKSVFLLHGSLMVEFLERLERNPMAKLHTLAIQAVDPGKNSDPDAFAVIARLIKKHASTLKTVYISAHVNSMASVFDTTYELMRSSIVKLFWNIHVLDSISESDCLVKILDGCRSLEHVYTCEANVNAGVCASIARNASIKLLNILTPFCDCRRVEMNRYAFKRALSVNSQLIGLQFADDDRVPYAWSEADMQDAKTHVKENVWNREEKIRRCSKWNSIKCLVKLYSVF